MARMQSFYLFAETEEGTIKTLGAVCDKERWQRKKDGGVVKWARGGGWRKGGGGDQSL